MAAALVGVADGLLLTDTPTSGQPPLGVRQMLCPTFKVINWQYVPRFGLNDCNCVLVIFVPVIEPAASATLVHVSLFWITYNVQGWGMHSFVAEVMEQSEEPTRKGLAVRTESVVTLYCWAIAEQVEFAGTVIFRPVIAQSAVGVVVAFTPNGRGFEIGGLADVGASVTL